MPCRWHYVFCRNHTRHFMPGWVMNVPLGQVAVWKRLNLVVYCLCHLLRLVPKARFVAQPGMKCRDQWRPFITKCQRHGTFLPSSHRSVHEQCAVPLALCFLSNHTRHFMPGWVINVPLGQVAVWKRLNLAVYCLCHLLRLVPKARFVAQPGMKCRDQWRPFITKCQRHGTFLPSSHRSVHEQCAVPLALLFSVETTPGISCRAGQSMSLWDKRIASERPWNLCTIFHASSAPNFSESMPQPQFFSYCGETPQPQLPLPQLYLRVEYSWFPTRRAIVPKGP